MDNFREDASINNVQIEATLRGRADFLSSYRVNLTKDECVYGASRVPEYLVATGGISATELFDIASERVPDDDEREVYMSYIDRYNLIESFCNGRKSVSINHTYRINGDELYLTTTVNMYKNPNTGDIEGIIYLYDISHQYMEKRIQSVLIDKEYESIALINAKDSTFSIYTQFLFMPDNMTDATVSEVDYIEHVNSVAEYFVMPEEKQQYVCNSMLDRIVDALEKEDRYFFTVNCYADDGEKRLKKFCYYYLDEKKELIVSTMEDVTGVLERDSLTGEFNRRGFVRETKRFLMENKDNGVDYAILFINIKGFKAINEFYGIDGGDMILRRTIDRLKYSSLKPIVMARSEADHFICLVRTDDIDYNTLPQLLWDSCTINNKPAEVMSLCGIYLINNIDVSVNRMCDRAMLANSQIKDFYVKPFEVYDESMKEAYMEKALSISGVDAAIENREFKVYIQPVYDAKTDCIASGEALIRWMHPKHGFIPPNKFIPALEESGLVSKVDLFVFNEIRDFLIRRANSNAALVPISTNLSWMDFGDIGMIEAMINDIENRPHPSEFVRFEVTETSYAGIAENNQAVLESFRNKGARILIDDFGSGYSSFSTITDYNFDILKLDMGFVRKIGQNSKVGSVIHSIIDMAHHMDVKVIAEGAETEDQVMFLKKHGCDYIQGYYYSKPLPLEEFEALLDA